MKSYTIILNNFLEKTMDLVIKNLGLDLVEKACVKAKEGNFSNMSDYLVSILENDIGLKEELDEETILNIIKELINISIRNRSKLKDSFTIQQLYTFCIKNDEYFTHPKWSDLTRSVRIELGRKFKFAISQHEETSGGSSYYLKQEGKNINNAALYLIDKK